jgi:hypothetical protein
VGTTIGQRHGAMHTAGWHAGVAATSKGGAARLLLTSSTEASFMETLMERLLDYFCWPKKIHRYYWASWATTRAMALGMGLGLHLHLQIL